MNKTECPSQIILEQLVRGEINSIEAAEIERHMLECEHCSTLADQLVSSSEITRIVAQDETHCFQGTDTEAVERLIEKARLMKPLFVTDADNTNVLEQTRQLQSGESADADATFATASPALQSANSDSAFSSFLQPPQLPDEIGRLGGYRILEVLGSGGMGVVYRAEDPALKRQVALKAMKPNIAADRDTKARFLREAEATAAIEHDNIVTIYQVGEDGGVPFIAMQFLKGESLQDRLNRVEHLSQKESIRIAKEIADGLQAAHAQGLIHRDIKPDNIWLQEGTDRVRILDFGLVRNVSDDLGMTQTGVVLGTPKYMAPEQARGESVDHRCDLFSLGSVLYRMISGNAPFDGSNLTAMLIAVAHQDPKPLKKVVADINPQLNDLITRLLSKDRDLRPESAAVVAQQLRNIETASTANRSPKMASSAGGKSPTRRVGVAVLIGFAAIFLLAAMIIKLRTQDGTIVIELTSETPVSQVEVDGSSVRFTPDASGKQLTVFVPEGTHQLSIKTADGLSLATELGNSPVQVSVNETTKIRAWLEKPANDASIGNAVAASPTATSSAVEGNSMTPLRDISKDKPTTHAPRRSPEIWPAGPLPAWASEEPRWLIMKESFTIPGAVERPSEFSNLGRWNVDTVQSRGAINVARYSPDGKWLATGSSDGAVRVLDTSTMKLKQFLPGIAGSMGVTDLAWHPDSKRIAVAADSSMVLRVWTIDGKLICEELANNGAYSTLGAVAWTFDGSRLICGGANRLEVRDDEGKVIKSLLDVQPDISCNIGNISVSPDSQLFACWHNDKVRMWNAETFAIEQTIDIPCPHWTGGHRIKWSSQDRIALTLDDRLVIYGADGNLIKEFQSETLSAIAWRPDGVTLTVWRYEAYDLNTSTGETTPANKWITVPTELGPIATALDWSSDGKQLVFAGGRLATCNETMSKLVFDTKGTFLTTSGLSLSPDGSQLATASSPSDSCIRIWSAEGVAQSSMPLGEAILTPPVIAWSSDGRHIALRAPQSNHFYIGSPGTDFVEVDDSCSSIAWSPDGTQLAAALTTGKILITDAAGKKLRELNTGETGYMNIAWSKQGLLVVHAGRKILRANLDSPESKLTFMADAPVEPLYHVPVWRPDGKEVCIASDLHLNVVENVADRFRQAPSAAAWAPDGSEYLNTQAYFISKRKAEGSESLVRVTNANSAFINGAWSPSGETVFSGCDQSMIFARNAEDLHVKWSAVILPNQRSVTFDVGGSILDGDRETLERDFVYYSANEAGDVQMLSLTEFELQTGREILAVPDRYFDPNYAFAINTNGTWTPASSDAFTVPGIARASFTRSGGVSLNIFIQETGAYVDPSWLVNESASSQERAFDATVIEKEVRKIAGRDAMWMIVEGQGTGGAITGNGPVKTTQHWIAIPRENDVLVALLTCPAGSFKENDALFQKSIETLTLKH